jgi:hypothetical protein
MKPLKEQLTNIPLIALVAANLLPIYGVVFFGWDAFNIIMLYWAENLVIGFYNILKMAIAITVKPSKNLGKLNVIPFFIVHYGIFVSVHGMLVVGIFGRDKGGAFFNAPHSDLPCVLDFAWLFVDIIWRCWNTVSKDMKYAIGSLFLSHGVSFVRNYLIAGEYLTSEPETLMAQPYPRVIVTHISILAGAFLTSMIGSPIGVLIVLIALKTFLDAKFHLRQHQAVVGIR